MTFAFSSCPNDTFAFHAIVHGLVGDVRVTPHIDDIEALNIRAADGRADVTTVSIAAYGYGLRDRYVLLRAGGAAGFGVGPILVAREPREIGGRIAIPGERTTANLRLPGNQHLYLRQPGYGATYITGGRLMEEVIAERGRQLGDQFSMQRVMDEINAAGMIPVSLIYWELTGDDRMMREVRDGRPLPPR